MVYNVRCIDSSVVHKFFSVENNLEGSLMCDMDFETTS